MLVIAAGHFCDKKNLGLDRLSHLPALLQAQEVDATDGRGAGHLSHLVSRSHRFHLQSLGDKQKWPKTKKCIERI